MDTELYVRSALLVIVVNIASVGVWECRTCTAELCHNLGICKEFESMDPEAMDAHDNDDVALPIVCSDTMHHRRSSV